MKNRTNSPSGIANGFCWNVVFIVTFTLFSACNNPSTTEKKKQHFDTIYPRFANGFRVLKATDHFVLQLLNHNKVETEYILSDNKELKNAISLPVKRVICLSSTQIAMLDFIDEIQSIVAVSGRNYCYSQNLQAEIEKGNIKEVGYEDALNIEMVMLLKPDIIFAYNISPAGNPVFKQIIEHGIPVVYINEFQEQEPLGKAEWGLFVSYFYNKQSIFQNRFDSIIDEYLTLRNNVAKTLIKRKTVFTGTPWKDVWYTAGGNSYAAKLIEDAGGSYIFRNRKKEQTLSLDFEEVYVNCKNTDFWINQGNFKSLKELKFSDSRFENFASYIKGNVYNNNLRENIRGTNDYFESGVMQPNIILKDLIKIFHPDLLKEHNLYYYRQLQ